MIHGRIETTPDQQLLELRHARDRYAALAEQASDQASEEDLERRRDARRILLAYEKSIANMTASMDRMHQAELLGPSQSGRRFKLATVIVSVVLFGGAVYYLVGPGAQLLRVLSAQMSQTAKPARGAVPAGRRSVLPPETAQTGNGSDGSPGQAISPIPIPIARPNDLDASPKPAGLRRPAEQIQPRQSPVRAKPIAAARTDAPDQRKSGFFAKVIQPDGSFKEEFFSSTPSR